MVPDIQVQRPIGLSLWIIIIIIICAIIIGIFLLCLIMLLLWKVLFLFFTSNLHLICIATTFCFHLTSLVLLSYSLSGLILCRSNEEILGIVGVNYLQVGCCRRCSSCLYITNLHSICVAAASCSHLTCLILLVYLFTPIKVDKVIFVDCCHSELFAGWIQLLLTSQPDST